METVEMDLMQAQIAELTTEVTRLKTGTNNIITITTKWVEETEQYIVTADKTPAQAYNIIKNGGYGLKYEPANADAGNPDMYTSLPQTDANIGEDGKYYINLSTLGGTSVTCAWSAEHNKYIWNAG